LDLKNTAFSEFTLNISVHEQNHVFEKVSRKRHPPHNQYCYPNHGFKRSRQNQFITPVSIANMLFKQASIKRNGRLAMGYGVKAAVREGTTTFLSGKLPG